MNKSNEELKREAREIAENYYRKGKYLCSEAILASINEVLEYNMPKEYISLVSAFPVGMGGSGCTCGALAGGQVALGLAYGRKKPGGNNKKVMNLSQELHNRFKENYKSTCCRVLIKDYKFGSKEHKERCTEVTGRICEETMDIILSNKGILEDLIIKLK